ncbi:MAG: HAD-IA family hydrolase [Mycobacterium sp.]
MTAILFGSISTLADTSELQRRAFNEAFEAHGLDWQWSRDDYSSMLGSNGGANRIDDYATSHGDDVDAAAVHATKSQIFQELLGATSIEPRPGVAATVEAAKKHGVKLAFVTTTSPENVAALLAALQPALGAQPFDLIVDSTSVDQPKPDPAAYAYALNQLGEQADGVVAIEDNVGGVSAAAAAGVACVAFPNANTAGGDFSAADETVDSLDAEQILKHVAS